jgi:DNA primase
MTAMEVRHRIATINEDAAAFYRSQLLAPQNTGPRGYLTERGFAQLLGDTEWTVGYAPDSWTSLHDHLAGAGYSDELMLEAGLTSVSRRSNSIDRFRNRLTFGIRDSDNELVGFTCRAAPTAPGSTPKYLNTPRTAAYDKSAVLFGLGEAATIKEGGTTVITEGPLDAIAVSLLDQARWVPLALCGTSLTAGHARSIESLTHPVLLALDNDPAGHLAMRQAIATLMPVSGEPASVNLPYSTDPTDVYSRDGAEELHALLKKTAPASDAVLTHLLRRWGCPDDNIERTLMCLRVAARMLASLGVQNIARHAARLAKTLNLESATVADELAYAVTSQQEGRLSVDELRERRCPLQAARTRPMGRDRVALPSSVVPGPHHSWF